MEQRITRAKARVAGADVAFETPGAAERSERLAAVAAMIYLIFNEGYSAGGDTAEIRAPLCEEAIRLARLLLRLFQSEPEIMGLTALLLLQLRLPGGGALRCRRRAEMLLDDQDRSLWNQKMIAEGLALVEKALRHRAERALSDPGGGRGTLHARRRETRGYRLDRDRSALRRARDHAASSPVVTLWNRAVAVSKVRGAQAALDMVEPLGERLLRIIFISSACSGAFLMQLGRNEEARDRRFARAIALANTPAEAAHIRMQLESP